MMNTFWAIIFGVFGSLLGSFANVCIWRLPRGVSISWPPSHCVHCQERLRPWHLAPIISWFFLRGRCAMCGGKIAWRYPAVEAATALLYALVGWTWQLSFMSGGYLVLIFSLVVAVGTDISHREIPDQISLGASAILFVLAVAGQNWPALIGGAVLFGFLYLIALASRGGMGGGDIKLALAIGLALGWQLGLVAIFVAFLVGGVLAIALMAVGRARGKAQVPFVPFLAGGAIIAMFLGAWIIQGYMNLSLIIWGW